MKKTSSILVLLFTALIFAFFTSAGFAQQSVPEEKKRAMHKLDPIDIFPQVQERGEQGRNRDKRTSNNEGSTILANESESSQSGKMSRRNSRRKNNLPETVTADLAGTVSPSPTPLTVSEASSAAATTAKPDLSTSTGSTGERANSTAASTQTLAAMNTSPLPSNVAAKDQTLPLPIILALLVLVLVMLILVFTRLIRYLRNPVS